MPAKQKKGRGKTVNLTDFNEDYIPETALDWAEDDWVSPEDRGVAKLSEKIAKQRQEYSRVANNTLGEQESFRTAAATQQQKRFTIDDLQEPFVAHFGNLRNGTTEEDFLSLFDGTSIERHRLINQDGKSFAFVEFKSAVALTVALSLDQTFQRGRRMYVDLATEKQVDRLLNRGTGERTGLSRDGTGQQQPGGLAGMDISRDVFGGVQPEEQQGLSRMSNNRSNFGSRADLHTLGDFSRDMLGSAVQASPTSASPLAGGGSPVNFSSWRNDGPETQPELTSVRENSRNDDAPDRRGMGAANLRRSSGEPTQQPAAPPAAELKTNPFGGDAGSWRDAPRVEAPKTEDIPAPAEEGEAAAAPSSNNTSSTGRGSGGRGNASGRGSPMGGRGGGRGGNTGFAERGSISTATAPRSSAPMDKDKWADLRR